ncbi:MAG: Hsp20 family protein [Paracoccaceae bacterium]
MRTFDLTPLYRSTVGFDRFASMLDQVLTADGAQPSYPPYNIEKTGEATYRITLAVAGFTFGDLDIEAREGVLVVRGGKAPADGESAPVYLHRGIAERSFERRFQLADHVRANGAALENGLLHIDLVHELPEALKPRKIEIGGMKAIENGRRGKKADA